ncbi:MAG: DM13 domain-containing protein [Acidobacteriota bacterium]
MFDRTPWRRIAGFVVAFTLLLGFAAPAFADDVVAQGSTWEKRTSKIKGEWKIVERNGRLFLQLGDGFKTKRAPDLKAFLTKTAPDGIKKKDLPADALRLGLLKSHKGAQELPLPAGATIDDYQSLIIHCEQYNKIWGVTALP